MTRVLLWLIRLYQRWLALLLKGTRPTCRYLPTCSEYAALAIERYGAARGSIRAIKRVLRCHPWGGSGHDPP